MQGGLHSILRKFEARGCLVVASKIEIVVHRGQFAPGNEKPGIALDSEVEKLHGFQKAVFVERTESNH